MSVDEVEDSATIDPDSVPETDIDANSDTDGEPGEES